jgi:hypothetical protein
MPAAAAQGGREDGTTEATAPAHACASAAPVSAQHRASSSDAPSLPLPPCAACWPRLLFSHSLRAAQRQQLHNTYLNIYYFPHSMPVCLRLFGWLGGRGLLFFCSLLLRVRVAEQSVPASSASPCCRGHRCCLHQPSLLPSAAPSLLPPLPLLASWLLEVRFPWPAPALN